MTITSDWLSSFRHGGFLLMPFGELRDYMSLVRIQIKLQDITNGFNWSSNPPASSVSVLTSTGGSWSFFQDASDPLNLKEKHFLSPQKQTSRVKVQLLNQRTKPIVILVSMHHMMCVRALTLWAVVWGCNLCTLWCPACNRRSVPLPAPCWLSGPQS